jgi:signal peptidase I
VTRLASPGEQSRHEELASPPRIDTTRVRHPQPMIWSLRLAIVIITLSILASAGWRLSGGSEYIIGSPSMCPTICVGALVLDQPAGTHLHVGEVISFVPPGLSTVYTHRIIYVFANGSIETKGDAANIIDPWRVYPSMVRGREIAFLPAAGWFDLALPFLAMALTLILLARRMFPTIHRREWDRLFVSLGVVIPIWLLKPLVRGVILQTASLRPGVSQIVVVNTGIFPTEFRIPGGQSAAFVGPGTRATLSGPVQHGGQLALTQVASFHWYGWALVALFVAGPLWWYLIHLMLPSSRTERELVLRGKCVQVPGSLSMPDMDLVLVKHDPRPRDSSRPFLNDRATLSGDAPLG